MPDLEWLDEYSGQTAEQLLSLEGQYRIDSLVLAFEQALQQKAIHSTAGLTNEERLVLAIEALEREVNNGGYHQFFINESREFAPIIVESLTRIECPRTATIAQKALNALRLSSLTVKAIEGVMAAPGKARENELSQCDKEYYEAGEDIAGRLFSFIKANRFAIRF
jgi:hypothetical protein